MATPEHHAEDVGAKIPEHWSAGVQPNAASFAHWLDTFHDPALTALVRAALADNYDIKAKAARVEKARRQAIIDGAGRLPQLSFGTSYQGEQTHDVGYGSVSYGNFYTMFYLSWELDVWGRIQAYQQAAEQEAIATQSDLRLGQLSLAALTARTYFELAEARLQVEVIEQAAKDRSIIAELVRGRFMRGLSQALEVRMVLTDVANAKAQLAQAQNQTQLLTRSLEAQLGRYPSGTLSKKPLLPEPPAELSAGLPSELLARRPDISAAFERLRAADSRLESAQKALLPRFSLTADGGTITPSLHQIVDPRQLAWNLMMGMAQPIFTGGRLMGEIDKNSALVDEALNTYKNTAIQTFKEVEQTLAAEQHWRDQELAYREAVEQTNASRSLALYSYQRGNIDMLTLLDRYRSTLTTQLSHLAAKRQLLNNRINLYLALGGEV